jgi:hypothetical protein
MSKRLDPKFFIEQCNLIHNNFYDYSLSVYVGLKTKIKIICPIHGIFEQTPGHHLYRKQGCPICGLTKLSNKSKLLIEEVIDRCKKIHNNFYSYYKIENYNGVRDKIKIICPNHGEFEQTIWHHMNGHGCPKCKNSLGEQKIENYLISKNIQYIPQKKFDDCKGIKRRLPFDFFIPDLNILIEYNGIQHYIPQKNFGGECSFQKICRTDLIKKEYSQNKNIKLLIIPYYEERNIIEILQKELVL